MLKISDEFRGSNGLRMKFYRFINHAFFVWGKDKRNKNVNCTTMVFHLIQSCFDIDMLEGGYGGCNNAKMLTSPTGKVEFIDENLSIEEKSEFLKTHCKLGDILFFHTEDPSETEVHENNKFPGHCAIYIDEHLYIDATTNNKNEFQFVEFSMDEDSLLKKLIAKKDFISYIPPTLEKEKI